MFDLPPPARFGPSERRFLAYLYGRTLTTPILPSLQEATLDKAVPNRGRAKTIYQSLERKKMLSRVGRRWDTGSFTPAGKIVARRFWEIRDRLAPPSKQTRTPIRWKPGMPKGSLHPDKVRSVRPDEEAFRTGVAIAKLGGKVTKGRLKGASIHFLTLEERATCPTSCAVWDSCYGNNMSFAVRWKVDAALLSAMDRRIALWAARGLPRLVRLHELGDFPSVEYVRRWQAWLENNNWLHVFGYTAWPRTSPIGRAIQDVKNSVGARFSIRWSGYAGADGSVVFEDKPPKGTFACPEQQKRVLNCGACGACWSTSKAVAFAKH
jgi:hypothetical protein